MTSNTQLPGLLVITLKHFELVNAEEDPAKTISRLKPDKAFYNSLLPGREHPDPHLQDTGFSTCLYNVCRAWTGVLGAGCGIAADIWKNGLRCGSLSDPQY